MDFKAIMKAILVPLIILVLLSFAIAGTNFYAYSLDNSLIPIIPLVQLVVGLIGLILVVWSAYKIGKATGSLAASAIGGIILELIPALLLGILTIVLIAPLASAQAGGGIAGDMASGITAGFGIIGLAITIFASIVGGAILGLIGGFFGKKKFSQPDQTMNQQFEQQNQGMQNPQFQQQPKMQEQWQPQQPQQQQQQPVQQQEYYRQPPSQLQPFNQTTQQQPPQQFSRAPQQPAQKFVPKLEKLGGETMEPQEKKQFGSGYTQEEETKEQIMSRMRESRQEEPPQPQWEQPKQKQEEIPAQETRMTMQGGQESVPKKLTRNQIEEFEQQFEQQPPVKKAPAMAARLTPEERDQATQLAQILADDRQNYSPDQVKKVIIEKGYSDSVAQEVVRRLYQM